MELLNSKNKNIKGRIPLMHLFQIQDTFCVLSLMLTFTILIVICKITVNVVKDTICIVLSFIFTLKPVSYQYSTQHYTGRI